MGTGIVRLICGYLHLDGRTAEAGRLDAMIQAMTAPGLSPRVARLADGPVALAVLDFDAMPEAPAQLPRGDSGLVLAADIRPNAALLPGLERHGAQALERLDDEFALALWDPRQRSLLCARDGIGVRPLVFSHVPGGHFVFASLPRGLHAAGLTARKLDMASVVQGFLGTNAAPDQPLFAGVEHMPPGTWLRIDADGRLQQGRHWQLDRETAGTCRLSPKDAAVHLRELIEAAARRRLPAQGPVAAHLSGGLDSSATTILAAREMRRRGGSVLAYSMVPTPFAGHEFGGDRAVVASVLEQEADVAWFPMRMGDPAAVVLPRMDEDQLFPADPNYTEVAIFADAASRGARVLVSGWGGDEGASYTHRAVLAEALLAGHWGYLSNELRALAAARGLSRARVAWREMSPYLLSERARRVVRRLTGRPEPVPLIAAKAQLLRPAWTAGRSLAWQFRGASALAFRLALLSGPGLPRRAGRWALAGARYGIAPVFPLLDRQVVEFSLSLPSTLFLRDGWSRRVFRDAMAGILPEPLRWKSGKDDLTVETPLYMALQRPLVLERLAAWRRSPAIADVFDLDAVEARLRALPSPSVVAGHIATGVDLAAAVTLLQVCYSIAFVEQHGGL